MSNSVDTNMAEQIDWPDVELTLLRNHLELLQHSFAKLQDTYEQLKDASETLQYSVEEVLDNLEMAIDYFQAFEDACRAAALTGEGTGIEHDPIEAFFRQERILYGGGLSDSDEDYEEVNGKNIQDVGTAVGVSDNDP
ncbi:hypothetical protein VPNG_09596 [Cytospora leucostoma]|uniref:Uncharacterized protein n=1 Tax=Cytospora leucostoma TaxID=1230097 RepID=A0A423VN53_9PEZI|nr:hypothetical protein VPNG_09596 [Cytospora leucostoma]